MTHIQGHFHILIFFQVTFDGNTDKNTPVRAVLAEQVFTSGIRIVPLTWYGDMIGMRYELTGCLSESEFVVVIF